MLFAFATQIGGQEQVAETYQAAGPPAEEAAPEASEAAAAEGAPADEEESAQDTASLSNGCSFRQIHLSSFAAVRFLRRSGQGMRADFVWDTARSFRH